MARKEEMTRRKFIRLSALGAISLGLAACGITPEPTSPPTLDDVADVLKRGVEQSYYPVPVALSEMMVTNKVSPLFQELACPGSTAIEEYYRSQGVDPTSLRFYREYDFVEKRGLMYNTSPLGLLSFRSFGSVGGRLTAVSNYDEVAIESVFPKRYIVERQSKLPGRPVIDVIFAKDTYPAKKTDDTINGVFFPGEALLQEGLVIDIRKEPGLSISKALPNEWFNWAENVTRKARLISKKEVTFTPSPEMTKFKAWFEELIGKHDNVYAASLGFDGTTGVLTIKNTSQNYRSFREMADLFSKTSDWAAQYNGLNLTVVHDKNNSFRYKSSLVQSKNYLVIPFELLRAQAQDKQFTINAGRPLVTTNIGRPDLLPESMPDTQLPFHVIKVVVDTNANNPSINPNPNPNPNHIYEYYFNLLSPASSDKSFIDPEKIQKWKNLGK